MYHSPVTNALWEARSSIFERMMDAGATAGGQPLPQTELLTKTPAQSRTSIVYKFAADDILQEHYRDPWNEVRIGKLLEDLDALAGTIAVKVVEGDLVYSKESPPGEATSVDTSEADDDHKNSSEIDMCSKTLPEEIIKIRLRRYVDGLDCSANLCVEWRMLGNEEFFYRTTGA